MKATTPKTSKAIPKTPTPKAAKTPQAKTPKATPPPPAPDPLAGITIRAEVLTYAADYHRPRIHIKTPTGRYYKLVPGVRTTTKAEALTAAQQYREAILAEPWQRFAGKWATSTEQWLFMGNLRRRPTGKRDAGRTL